MGVFRSMQRWILGLAALLLLGASGRTMRASGATVVPDRFSATELVEQMRTVNMGR